MVHNLAHQVVEQVTLREEQKEQVRNLVNNLVFAVAETITPKKKQVPVGETEREYRGKEEDVHKDI